jgi:6-phosphofructokinase
MGRDAGWVALAASDAARHVNICLIPEFEVRNKKKYFIFYLLFIKFL